MKQMLAYGRKHWRHAVVGAAAGAANGFFGSGGGLFLAPLFIGWLRIPQRKAFATSIAVILPLSAVSAVVYALGGGMDWLAAAPYLAGGAAGGAAGGLLLQRLPVTWLRRGLGVLILYGGVRALFLL